MSSLLPALDEFCLGQKCEREELDIAERRLQLEQDRHELEVSKRDKALEHTSKAVALIQSFTTIDERTKLQFEDHIKNVVLSSGRSFAPQRAMVADNGEPNNETESLSVSVLAGEMGYICTDQEIQAIGQIMATKYRGKYDKDPPKHKQYVNSYMVRDRAMMEESIREVVSGQISQTRGLTRSRRRSRSRSRSRSWSRSTAGPTADSSPLARINRL
jgi:hypothetical protein